MVGGLAVNAHGFGRPTWDVDLVIRLEPDVIRRAFAALGSLGYAPRVPITADGFADPEQRRRWIKDKGMMVLNFYSDAHRETPVDVFVTEPFDFAEDSLGESGADHSGVVAGHARLHDEQVKIAVRAGFPARRRAERDELKALANERDVPYQSLMKVFLAERIARERRARRQGRAAASER